MTTIELLARAHKLSYYARHADAQRYYAAVVQQDPGNHDAYIGVIRSVQKATYGGNPPYGDYITFYQDVVKKFPDDVVSIYTIGLYYTLLRFRGVEEGGKYDLVSEVMYYQEAVDKANQLDKYSILLPAFYSSLAKAYEAFSDQTQATEILKQLDEYKASSTIDDDYYNKLKETFQSKIAAGFLIDWCDDKALDSLGYYYEKSKRYGLAVDCYELSALKLPGDNLKQLSLANAYREMGETEKANIANKLYLELCAIPYV